MNFRNEFMVKPGKRVKIADFDAGFAGGFKRKAEAKERLQQNTRRLAELQHLLYAEGKRALLIIIQAMDAGGKDGTVRSVMSGVNPQGCTVVSFKAPTGEELAHDFLWRVHKVVPPKGMIGIFNRSHYEDVLIVRVHDLVPKSIWSKRYEQINDFERMLADNDVHILKFFLNISSQEQKKRLRQRLKRPEKNWKVNVADFDERKYWDRYMQAYEAVLARCSTEQAPWFVIPSDKKWFRSLAVSEIIVDTLAKLDMKFPPPPADLSKIKIQ